MTHQVPLERVVAVIAELPDGREQWGSGYLITRDLVLTAWHCTVERASWVAVPLRVQRWVDGGWQTALIAESDREQSHQFRADGPGHPWGLDVALLTLRDPPWAGETWSSPPFARVVRTESGELGDCVAVGYPMFALARDSSLDSAEVNGFIRLSEAKGSGHLVLRDTKLGSVQVPAQASNDQRGDKSPWGGLSGAAVFREGRVLGHVVQHHPQRGDNALTVIPITDIAESDLRGAQAIAKALGLKKDVTLLTPASEKPEPIDVLDFPFRLGQGRSTPSGLLRAWDGVVKFVGEKRTADRVALEAWAREVGADATSIRVYTSDAGQGKTRLALEACQILDESGWLAGFIAPSAREFSDLAEFDRDRFLVLDDAVAHLDQLRGLADAAYRAASDNLSRCALVVLTRDEGLPAVQGVLDAYQSRLTVTYEELDPLPVDDRVKVYERARRDFACRLHPAGEPPGTPNGHAVKEPTAEGLGRDYFSVLASALLDVKGRAGILQADHSADDLRDEVLASEADWWVREARAAGLALDRGTLQQVVAVSCLAVPRAATDQGREARAYAVLRLLPGLRDARTRTLRRIQRWEQGLYGGGDLLNPMRPHTLATHIAAGLVEQVPGLLAHLIDTGTDANDARQVVRTLTTLLPAFDTRPMVAAEVAAAVSEQLEGLVALALAQAGRDDPESRALSLEAVLAHALSKIEIPDRAAQVAPRLPSERNLALDDLTLALQRQEVTHRRRELAAALRRLSTKRSDVSQVERKSQDLSLEEALESVQQYVTSAQPAQPARAETPAQVAIPDEALERLVGRCIDLPTAGRCDVSLADALSNLSVRLLEVDRRTMALKAALAAKARLPNSDSCDHPACRRVHAETTSNLSRARRDAGYPTAAVGLAEEALKLYRGLYDDDPVTYRGDWGMAERRYARCLASVGRYGGAIRHAQRAVDLFETAARKDKNRWKPDEARAHQNLAEWLILADRIDEASQHHTAAVQAWDELAKDRPVSYGDQIAQCNLLACRILTQLQARTPNSPGDQIARRAVMSAQQAVQGFRVVSTSARGAQDSLAEALLAESAAEAALASRGRKGVAITYLQDSATMHASTAVELLGEMAAEQRAFGRSLSTALLTLSQRHAEAGQPVKAEAEAARAVSAAEVAIAATEPDDLLLAVARLAHAQRLQDGGQPGEARVEAQLAQSLLKKLADHDPDPAKRPDRLGALRKEAARLLTVQHPAPRS